MKLMLAQLLVQIIESQLYSNRSPLLSYSRPMLSSQVIPRIQFWGGNCKDRTQATPPVKKIKKPNSFTSTNKCQNNQQKHLYFLLFNRQVSPIWKKKKRKLLSLWSLNFNLKRTQNDRFGKISCSHNRRKKKIGEIHGSTFLFFTLCSYSKVIQSATSPDK